MLAHLAALLVEDVPETEHGLIRRAVVYECADGHERVEPAAGLVDRLGDELRGILALELFVVAMRCAPLRERHRARVVPRVDDLGDALHRRTALRAREGDVV